MPSLLRTVLRVAGLAGLLGLGAGCALRPTLAPPLEACLARYAEADARIARAGAADQGAVRIPGFPYLRSTRFLASFRDEVHDPRRAAAWIEHLRQQDLALRALEWRSVGGDSDAMLAVLEDCGAQLAAVDLADRKRLGLLRQRAAVPDEYSRLRRVLGMYPLTAPLLRAGIAEQHESVRRDYRLPRTALAAGAQLQDWRAAAPVAPVAPATTAAWQQHQDVLGIPQLDDVQWQRLFATHAPAYRIETRGPADRPGHFRWENGRLRLDTREARVYTQAAFTRFAGEVLPQLIYVIWFTERPPTRHLDPYAGWLDGLIWRVTLGTDGTPLVYDSIHPCGCYHMVYPVRALRRRSADPAIEPMLMPQDELPAGPVLLHLGSGSHALRRVLPQAELQQAKRYKLVPYAQLQALADAKGQVRSIFGPEGLIAGSERGERWWLWPSGVISPGAMRQLGRHATAFVGMRHFDDPDLLDRLFHQP